jgi:DNA-binding MarR family transcriptional regulator
MMTENIRSFLSSLAFMMGPRVAPGQLYTGPGSTAASSTKRPRPSKIRIGFAAARVQNTVFKESAHQEAVMIRNDLDPLILDLLEWIGREPRSYAEVIDAWRTSCPRLTVWEDAMDRGFAAREHAKGREVMIRLTAAGREFLREHGRIAHTDTNAAVIAGLDLAIHPLQ